MLMHVYLNIRSNHAMCNIRLEKEGICVFVCCVIIRKSSSFCCFEKMPYHRRARVVVECI